MNIGTVVKILHNEQKHYAVVAGYTDKDITVVFPVADGKAISLKEKTLPLAEVRRVTDSQTMTTAFVLLRQLVGIRFEQPKPKPMGMKLGAPSMPGGFAKDKNTGEFTFNGVPVSQLPEELKPMAESIVKNLQGTGATAIEFAAPEPPDTDDLD